MITAASELAQTSSAAFYGGRDRALPETNGRWRFPKVGPPSSAAILALAAFLLLVAIFTWPLNRDEGQYVAATAMMRNGLPYRDFAFLQTPLQPLLFAPLSNIPAGYLFLASRLASAFLAWLALLFVMDAVRTAANPRAAVATGAAMSCCNIFIFAGSLARNDALPLALLGLAIALLLRADRRGNGHWMYSAAGLALGLSVSAKISFAFPAAAAGTSLLPAWRQLGWRPFCAVCAGGIAGLAPTMALAALAPPQFMFGVFRYSLEAPQQWWTGLHDGAQLQSFTKLRALAGYALAGPIAIALLAVAIDRRKDCKRRMLDLMIVGSAVAAYLPDPSFKQYLVPLIAPLFVRFGLVLADRPLKPLATAALAICGAIGLAPLTGHLVRALHHGSPLLLAVHEGRQIAAAACGRTLATLSPAPAAGSDVKLSRGFVTGPFLYRTRGPLSDAAWFHGFSPTPARPDRLNKLDLQAVIVGREQTADFAQELGLDVPLEHWAIRQRFRASVLGCHAEIYRDATPCGIQTLKWH